MSASISLEPLERSSQNFTAVARSSSDGVAIRYVLPVLRTTSRLAVVGRVAMRMASGVAIPERSLMSMNALLIYAVQRFVLVVVVVVVVLLLLLLGGNGGVTFFDSVSLQLTLPNPRPTCCGHSI